MAASEGITRACGRANHRGVKLATWNVNSIRARQERALSWLRDRAPDVVCLQETKVPDDAFPAEICRDLGYEAVFHGQRGYNGVAILSRLPISDGACGLDDGEDDSQARLVAATVRGIRVISVYVPNGQAVGSEKYAYKLAWLERLRRYLERCCSPDQPVVLAGDFNVAPDDRDVHDPAIWEGKIMCSDAERAGLEKVCEWGLRDTFRLHEEGAGFFSWWDYRMLGFPKNRGLRIDHIYATEPLLRACTSAHIDREERKGKLPSDHAPVFAEFSL
jgi:exodeoxyribonuclease III